MNQTEQVVAALKRLGGCATLKDLYEEVFRGTAPRWKTRTPFASIRRIVQQAKAIAKLQPGLYCLKSDYRKFKHLAADAPARERQGDDIHALYQGYLLEIGRFRDYATYIPPQDKRRIFPSGMKRLEDMRDMAKLPDFSYPRFTRQAKTIDVIWFNQRNMPAFMFEVEYTTNLTRSFEKFSELRDFAAAMVIVADESRADSFHDKLHGATFSDMRNRIAFWSFDKIAKLHSAEETIEKTRAPRF